MPLRIMQISDCVSDLGRRPIDLHNSSGYPQPHPVIANYDRKAEFNYCFIIHIRYSGNHFRLSD